MRALGAALMVSLLVACSAGPELPLEERLQRVLDTSIEKHGVRGASAAVVFPDREIWLGTSGLSHESVAMDPGLLVFTGSITKNVVAALTLKLAEEGKLFLEDPVSRWLPGYPHVDGNITLRQLLNHTSGIYMFWENQEIWDEAKRDPGRVWAPEEVLASIQEPDFPPGEGWRYSNTNYLLLAMIIERATDSTLSAELRRCFWDPLGIEDAYLAIQDEVPDHRAHVWGDHFGNDGDVTFEPRAAHDSIAFGSGDLVTTPRSLARWCDALFRGKVLQPGSMDQMLDFVERGFAFRKTGYGLGVMLYRKRFAFGERAIGHGGGNIGSVTSMIHLPEHRLSVVVMVNRFDAACARAATRGLIKTILKDAGVLGPIPYFDYWPLVILAAFVFVAINLIRLLRKRRRAKAA